MVKDMKKPMLASKTWTMRLQPFSLEWMSSGSYEGGREKESRRERERGRPGGEGMGVRKREKKRIVPFDQQCTLI